MPRLIEEPKEKSDYYTEQNYWTETIYDILANVHTFEVVEGIIKPAVNQVLLDYEDSLGFYDPEYDEEAIEWTHKLIAKWRRIKEMIDSS